MNTTSESCPEGDTPPEAPLPARLSARQQEVVGAIRTLTAEHGYPPTVRELCQALGLRSTATMHVYLQVLRTKGVLRPANKRTRTLVLIASPHLGDPGKPVGSVESEELFEAMLQSHRIAREVLVAAVRVLSTREQETLHRRLLGIGLPERRLHSGCELPERCARLILMMAWCGLPWQDDGIGARRER